MTIKERVLSFRTQYSFDYLEPFEKWALDNIIITKLLESGLKKEELTKELNGINLSVSIEEVEKEINYQKSLKRSPKI